MVGLKQVKSEKRQTFFRSESRVYSESFCIADEDVDDVDAVLLRELTSLAGE